MDSKATSKKGPKPFACSECNKKFRGQEALNDHYRDKHANNTAHDVKKNSNIQSDVPQFTCGTCFNSCDARPDMIHDRHTTCGKPAHTATSTTPQAKKVHGAGSQSNASSTTSHIGQGAKYETSHGDGQDRNDYRERHDPYESGWVWI